MLLRYTIKITIYGMLPNDCLFQCNSVSTLQVLVIPATYWEVYWATLNTTLISPGPLCMPLCPLSSRMLYQLIVSTPHHRSKQHGRQLPDKHPLTFPSLVELDGRLVAMGGSVDEQRRTWYKVHQCL